MPDNHSIEAEQALLGAVLMSNAAWSVVENLVSARDFFEPMHRDLWDVVGKLVGAGKVANPVTVQPFIPADAMVGSMTVRQYVARLAAEATTIVNAPDYARVVRDFSHLRDVAGVGMALCAPEAGADASELAGEAIERLDEIASQRASKTSRAVYMDEAVTRAIDAAANAYARDGAMTGIPFGLRDLDAKTSGAQAGDLIILAARPSMGKSALALGIARNMAKAGYAGDFYSLEMGDVSLTHRMISDEMFDSVPLSYSKIRSGRFNERNFTSIRDAGKVVAGYPIRVDQEPGLMVSQLGARLRQSKRRRNIQFAIVDYLGLMRASQRYAGSKVNEIGEITAGLKGLAKDLEIPLIVLAQLSRQVETREDKRPIMSDLRDAGSIEQDADVVMFVYREAYYLQGREPKIGTPEHEKWSDQMLRAVNEMDIIIAKQRNGPTGYVKLYADMACNAIRDEGWRRGQNRDAQYLPELAF